MGARFTRRAALAGTALLAATGLAACGGGGGSTGGGSSDTLTVAWTATPTQLDPNVFTGLTWLYALDASMATLVEYDTSVSSERVIGPDDLIPSLAESWEESQDGLSYTIKLREGVESPNGNELTADDVVYSFDRMYSNETALQPSILLPTANVDPDNPMEKIDEYTVQYNLTAPSAIAMSVLAYPGLGILDSAEVKEHATGSDEWASDWLANNIAGFGPYQLDTLDPGNEVRFSANPNWFGDRGFDNLVIRAVPDGASRAQLVASGEVDLISEPPIDQLPTIEGSNNARVSEMPDTNRHNITLSEKSPILSKPLVRQAINRAINRDGIVDSIYQGYAEPAMYPISSELVEDQPVVGEYDVDQAKQLLTQAGYPDGFDMTLTYSTERPGPFAGDLARLIQSDLGAIGINVDLSAVPSVADFEAGVSDQKYEAYLYTERPAQPEIGYDLFLYLYAGSALNKSGYDNPEFDGLVDQILDLTDSPERQQLVDQAIEILAENDPIVSLVEVPDLAGVSESVDGFSALPSGGTMFSELTRN